MLLISCVWCLALLCHLISLDMLCVNSSCLLSISDMWIMQCHVFQPVIIYVNYAPPWSQAPYMWIISCHLFFSLHIPFVDNLCILNYSSCVSAIWAGYGKIWSENKVFRAGNGTCWSIYLDGYRELLRGGFRDRWPVLYPTWGVCSKLKCLYFSYDAYGVLHCLV